MKIDKMKNDRIDFAIAAVADIVIAAAYSIPGGPTAKATLELFRNKSLASALWLLRSSDSELKNIPGIPSFFGGNSVNSLSTVVDADGNPVLVNSNAAFTPFAARGTGASLFKGNDNLLKQLEADAGGALSGVVDRDRPGMGEGLKEITYDTAERATQEHMAEVDRAVMLSTYMQVLGQLDEIRQGGDAALLPYALAAFADNVQLPQLGVAIANLGGYKVLKAGVERMALGDKEVDEALKDKKTNRLQVGWRKRKWVQDPKIIETQRKMSPQARGVYEALGWEPARVDKILIFKAKMATYRSDFEAALAQLDVDSVTKHVVKDADASMASHGFTKASRTEKYLTGRHGLFRLLGQKLTFGHFFNTTAQGAQRGALIIDCYVLYKVLEFHLGTPWIAALPKTPKSWERVCHALVDAWMTITLSKWAGKKRVQDCYPPPPLFGNPTVLGYWSPLGKVLAATEDDLREYEDDGTVDLGRFARDALRQRRDELLAMPEGFSATPYLLTLPGQAKTRRDPGAPYRVPLDEADFTVWMQQLYQDRYESALGSARSSEDLQKWRDDLQALADAMWESEKQSGQSALSTYVRWTKRRQAALDMPRVKAETVSQYEKLSSEVEDPVMSAYLAQKMGMELLTQGAVKPEEVLKLMHDTIRKLVEQTSKDAFTQYRTKKRGQAS